MIHIRKNKKQFIINCIVLIFLLSIYSISEYILSLYNLTFMYIVMYIFYFSFFILLIIILTQLMGILYTISKKQSVKLSLRFMSGIGVAAVICFMIISFIFGFFLFAFSYTPEHVVVKDGKQMVACVNSFLQVNVDYYDYVNKFVRGNKLKINEDYGNGGYDPFQSNQMPEVERYIYFDDNGEVTKSNWLN